MRKVLFKLSLFCASASLAVAQNPPAPSQPARPAATRPSEMNVPVGIRPLVAEEIWPNLNYYVLDPLYRSGIPLGWATERIEEKLDRGLRAQLMPSGKVYLGWRLLKKDPKDIAFNLYRSTSGANAVKLNSKPLRKTTDFVDDKAPTDKPNAWFVKPVVNSQEQAASERIELPTNPPVQPYQVIKLKADVRGVSNVGIGDLDGDGTYDFVVKHPGGGKDPGRVGPNRGAYKYDGYNGKTGEFMWRIDLGWNVDMGIWWTPMIVRDLDGDGKAEVCVRTSSYAGTQDEMLPSGRTGFLTDAPEYLAVYDGATGNKIDQVPWIELGKVEDWGDHTGNRASRHMMGVAYLDGKTPSVLAFRGQYGLMKVDAWMLKDKKLVKVWRWTNERAGFTYQAAGQHSIKTGDLDGDGCDEILNGAIVIDHDGKTLWSTGYGHGDRFYLGDIDPDRPGLEVWMVYEDPHPRNGASLWDTTTGGLIFGIPVPSGDNQIGRALAGDIDSTYPGMELAGGSHYYTSKGEKINEPSPPQEFLVWWDADLLREIYARGTISKWKGTNWMKIPGSALQIADIYGDWREEIVTYSNGELRIYSTTIPAADRRVCLMQDPLYRNDVTHRTVGYAHYPMTSYYLGTSTPRGRGAQRAKSGARQ
jgi:rhamnogalacturonan endolyase